MTEQERLAALTELQEHARHVVQMEKELIDLRIELIELQFIIDRVRGA